VKLSPAQIRALLRVARSNRPCGGIDVTTVEGRTANSLVLRKLCCEVDSHPGWTARRWLMLTERGDAWLAGFAAGQEWEAE
jgi:hypothetical protein